MAAQLEARFVRRFRGGPAISADLVLPARWLGQALHSALRLRSETIELQHRLDVEIGHVEEHLEANRRAAKEVDLLKNAIVRTVSHELKTPLLHVKSAVSMLSDGSDQERHKLIGYATEATARLEAVVHPSKRERSAVRDDDHRDASRSENNRR